MNDMEPSTDARALLPRRTILKFIASAPLVATFGFASSPLLRYFKPSMKAGGFCQTADLPQIAQPVRFHRTEFPAPWTCQPFSLPLRYTVFNTEGHENREEPGFILRTAGNEVIAFSRICPNYHHHPLNFLMNTAELPCIPQSKYPVLYCPCACCFCTFDLNDNGRVMQGNAARPLRRMEVTFDGEHYTVIGLAQPEIV